MEDKTLVELNETIKTGGKAIGALFVEALNDDQFSNQALKAVIDGYKVVGDIDAKHSDLQLKSATLEFEKQKQRETIEIEKLKNEFEKLKFEAENERKLKELELEEKRTNLEERRITLEEMKFKFETERTEAEAKQHNLDFIGRMVLGFLELGLKGMIAKEVLSVNKRVANGEGWIDKSTIQSNEKVLDRAIKK